MKCQHHWVPLKTSPKNLLICSHCKMVIVALADDPHTPTEAELLDLFREEES